MPHRHVQRVAVLHRDLRVGVTLSGHEHPSLLMCPTPLHPKAATACQR